MSDLPTTLNRFDNPMSRNNGRAMGARPVRVATFSSLWNARRRSVKCPQRRAEPVGRRAVVVVDEEAGHAQPAVVARPLSSVVLRKLWAFRDLVALTAI